MRAAAGCFPSRGFRACNGKKLLPLSPNQRETIWLKSAGTTTSGIRATAMHLTSAIFSIESFSSDKQLLHQLVPLGIIFFRFFDAVFLVDAGFFEFLRQ
jgi:hypothetical protein